MARSAKDIRLEPIASKDARRVIAALHYSGKFVNNSQLHLGVFLNGVIKGALSFGPGIDKRKLVGLVQGTGWNEFVELNRMALADDLPRNCESRALAVSMRLLRKHAPHVKWVVTFADATQCGDGTIYRASGFVLTAIKRNAQILRMPDGSLIARKTLDNPNHMGGDGRFGGAHARESGAVPLPGYQFRYVYFLDPAYRSRLTVPVIPFDRIPPETRMYRGQRAGSIAGDASVPPDGRGRLDTDPGALVAA